MSFCHLVFERRLELTTIFQYFLAILGVLVFDEDAEDMEVDQAETEDEDDSWMTPDEGDEVVKELDVCVSTRLAQHIQVLQFPLRPKNRQFENNKEFDGGIKMRFKPKVWPRSLSFCPGCITPDLFFSFLPF